MLEAAGTEEDARQGYDDTACTLSWWPGDSMLHRGLCSLLPGAQPSLLGERLEFLSSSGISHRPLENRAGPLYLSVLSS